jgi:DNA (cytosine-5)-methyltransferase 1
VNIKTGALFAGIGGLDLGFHQNGSELVFASEIDPVAQAVLKRSFLATSVFADITKLQSIPKVDLLTAGFPCQDISLAGTRLGLLGTRSGLVNEVFRLVETSRPEFVLVENVLNLLRLERGNAMRSILSDFESLGYRWAYRVVDTRGFGLPQRRMRVVILATNGERDPGHILLPQSAWEEFSDPIQDLEASNDYGFYWTEGKRGIGWAINSVPTIKGGSGLGIPSAPAVFSMRHQLAGTISIEAAERLQGFPPGWTDVPEAKREGDRWRLIGNAVSVPLSSWISKRLADTNSSTPMQDGHIYDHEGPLPKAAFGSEGRWESVMRSSAIEQDTFIPLRSFLEHPLKPLSHKALSGYLKRAHEGKKKYPEGFLEALELQKVASTREKLPPIIL